MDPLTIALLVITAVTAISSGISSYAQTKKTNEANKEEYEDWKAYNSPANQMSRLTEAGLSPYMVNGVSNTLSQPFQVGANQGISEMLGSLSQATQQAATYAGNYGLKKEANLIQKDKVGIQRDALDFQKSFGELKKQMMRTAIKKGDAQAAMFWASVDQKQYVTNYLKRIDSYRVGSAHYDYLAKKQAYHFNELMNPQILDYYAPSMRAKINNLIANTHYLRFREDFAMQQLLQDMIKFNATQSFNDKWNWLNYNQRDSQFNSRLGLSSQYFDLAYDKWISDMVFRGIGAYQNRRGQFLNFAGKFIPFKFK